MARDNQGVIVETDAKEIMVKLIAKYPTIFGHVEVDRIGFIRNLKKKSDLPTKLVAVKHPHDIWNDNTYILEIFGDCWGTLEQKQKNLAIAQVLCSIHSEGFSENSKNYGKTIKPNIVSYLEVFSLSGGIPNWLENPSALDPLEGQMETETED